MIVPVNHILVDIIFFICQSNLAYSVYHFEFATLHFSDYGIMNQNLFFDKHISWYVFLHNFLLHKLLIFMLFMCFQSDSGIILGHAINIICWLRFASNYLVNTLMMFVRNDMAKIDFAVFHNKNIVAVQHPFIWSHGQWKYTCTSMFHTNILRHHVVYWLTPLTFVNWKHV